MRNALSVDVEEYFHATEVQDAVGNENWAFLPSRVEPQTDCVLEMLATRNVSATFFVVGWVARLHPRLIRRIAAAGHEIGCHSYAHRLVYDLTPSGFQQDTQLAIRAIEDAAGVSPRAYRAPSFSITSQSLWALEVLAACGFTHDSSIYPIRHDRYGIPSFSRYAQTLTTPSGPIIEIPAATVQLPGNRIAPVGGGGYLRLLPYAYVAAGIRRINQDENAPACVYFHPWELDSKLPQVASTWTSWVRTYAGIPGMASKLDRLLRDFQFAAFRRVYPENPSGGQ
jgi:polysaccharide deacetylase family protein (PEP-CTERM system associated)